MRRNSLQLEIVNETLTKKEINEVELVTTSKYLLDSSILINEVWFGKYAIFYNKGNIAPYEYFALDKRVFDDWIIHGYENKFIKDATDSAMEPIMSVMSDDGECIYSSYRYDFRTSKDGTVAIDGGRSYTRIVGHIKNRQPIFRIIDGDIYPINRG